MKKSGNIWRCFWLTLLLFYLTFVSREVPAPHLSLQYIGLYLHPYTTLSFIWHFYSTFVWKITWKKYNVGNSHWVLGISKKFEGVSLKLNLKIKLFQHISDATFCHPYFGTVDVATTAQFHLTKSKLRFCTGSNPTCSILKVCDGENLWKWSWLGMRLNTCLWSTIL